MSVNILKDFISENAGPISIKFHVQLQGRDVAVCVCGGGSGGGGGGGGGRGRGGWNFYLNGPGHMPKMAATSSPYMVLT